MAERQNINVGLLVAVGSISTVLLIVVVLGVQAWFYAEQQREVAEKSVGARNIELETLRFEQIRRISTYRIVDEDKQTVAIPIERAIPLVLEEYRDNSPR